MCHPPLPSPRRLLLLLHSVSRCHGATLRSEITQRVSFTRNRLSTGAGLYAIEQSSRHIESIALRVRFVSFSTVCTPCVYYVLIMSINLFFSPWPSFSSATMKTTCACSSTAEGKAAPTPCCARNASPSWRKKTWHGALMVETATLSSL